MNALDKLIAQGIPATMAARIIAQIEDEANKKAEKKTKATRAYHAANNTKTKKDIEVEVSIKCECCGNVVIEKRVIKALPDSPTTMKTSTSLCNECPSFIRNLTHEQLVALVITKEHPAISREYKMLRSQLVFAKKYTPEELVTMTLAHF